MSRSKWIKSPEKVRETCHCKVLPITLKGLQSVVNKYNQNSKVNWHRVQFEYLSIMARVLQIKPTLVLADNTAIFSYDYSHESLPKDIFIKTVYYRFIFQLNPYSSQSVSLSKVQMVTPKETVSHMMEVIRQEMFATAHEKILKLKEENKDFGANQDLKMVRGAVRHLGASFTVQEVRQKTKLADKVVEDILQKMCDNQELGDMGNFGYCKVNVLQDDEEEEPRRMEAQ